jgi:hypothetical protein
MRSIILVGWLTLVLFSPSAKAQMPTCNSGTISATWGYDNNLVHTSVGGVANATSVWIAVWSSYNGQNDLVWQSAGNIGGGTWISDFWPPTYESGTYNVAVYMWNASYSAIGCGSITSSRTLPSVPPPTCTAATYDSVSSSCRRLVS